MSPLTESTRVVLAKGQPVPNDPSFSFTSLLLHGDGANGSTTILDSSPSPKTVTAFGNAQISTAQSKFGGSSIYLDGNGDYLKVASSAAFAFGSGDFTVELWAYMITTSDSSYIVDTRDGSLTGFPWLLGVIDAGINYTANWPTNTWVHAACSRQGATTKIFKDGSQVASISSTYNYLSQQLYIGTRFNIQNFFQGYINDLRITKGVARYTSNFTPPTAPFPDF